MKTEPQVSGGPPGSGRVPDERPAARYRSLTSRILYAEPIDRGEPSTTTVLGTAVPLGRRRRDTDVLIDLIACVSRQGWEIISVGPSWAQLRRRKRLDLRWAALSFLALGVGLLVYLLIFAAKEDEIGLVRIDGLKITLIGIEGSIALIDFLVKEAPEV